MHFSKGVGHFEWKFQTEGAFPTNHCPFAWYQNICSALYGFVTECTYDRQQTDRQNYDSQDCTSIAASCSNKTKLKTDKNSSCISSYASVVLAVVILSACVTYVCFVTQNHTACFNSELFSVLLKIIYHQFSGCSNRLSLQRCRFLKDTAGSLITWERTSGQNSSSVSENSK